MASADAARDRPVAPRPRTRAGAGLRVLAATAVAGLAAIAAIGGVPGGRAVASPETPGPATAERWARWHEDRALRLAAEGRFGEVVEERVAVAILRADDPDAAALAAIAAVEAGTSNRVLQPADPLYQLAEFWIVRSVARGGLHDPALAYAIGRLRFTDRKWRVAWRMLDDARRRGFEPVRADYWWFRSVVNVAPEYYGEGKLDDGIALLRRALDEVPGHPERLAAYINLVSGYRRRNEQTLAEQLLRDEVLPTWPRVAKVRYALAQVLADHVRLQEAADELGRAMEMAQESDDELYAGPEVYREALELRATIELRRGRVDEAEALARSLLRLQPDGVEGLYLIGSVHATRGSPEDLSEAARKFRQVARLDPTHEAARARLLEVLQYLGEGDGAEAGRVKAELDAIRAAAEPK